MQTVLKFKFDIRNLTCSLVMSEHNHSRHKSPLLFIIYRVIDGLETLDDLEKLPVNEKTYRPLTDVRIKNVTIHANPIAEKSY